MSTALLIAVTAVSWLAAAFAVWMAVDAYKSLKRTRR